MKSFKIISVAAMLVTFFFCNSYFYLVYKNNVDTPPPSKQSIQQALDKSINWVLKNQDELIKINNPVLWWFLDESASLTNNYKLSKLIWKYRNTVLDKNSIWTGYWVKKPPFTYIPGSLDHMEKYQKFFTYGLTCDLDLSEEKVIQDQLDENFCDWHPYYSSCITHQIMGVRLLQIKQCGDQEQNKKLVKKLAKLIESQLIWDPRVGDVYIQRVLTLVDSGNKEKIKPVWIKQILNEQRTDGSWANFYRLFNITNKTEFGLGYTIPEIRSPAEGSFHTTTQAVYLLSLINQ